MAVLSLSLSPSPSLSLPPQHPHLSLCEGVTQMQLFFFFTISQRPMDLSTVERNLDDYKYQNVEMVSAGGRERERESVCVCVCGRGGGGGVGRCGQDLQSSDQSDNE